VTRLFLFYLPTSHSQAACHYWKPILCFHSSHYRCSTGLCPRTSSFSLYTSPISSIFASTPVSFHLYADDTQLYISFSSSESSNSLASLSSTLDTVYSWLTLNRLSVNPDKTEYLLFGTYQQRSKVIDSSVSFQGKRLNPSSHARNLGVVFESDLSFSRHISNVCRTSFHHIRQLRQVRSSLDHNSSIMLANALVSSKLDYCNSLLYRLPNKMQLVSFSGFKILLPGPLSLLRNVITISLLFWQNYTGYL